MVSRKSLFVLHNKLGLAALVLVLASATTGALLTFRSQFHEPPPPAPVVAEHLPLEQLIAKAEAAGDGSPATDIQLALEPEQAYLVWLDDDAETQVFLDGAGNVLDTRPGVGVMQWLFRVHTGEMFGVVGQGLMFATALGLCVLAATGFGMWWSRWRAKS